MFVGWRAHQLPRKLKKKSKSRATTTELNVKFEMLTDDPGGKKNSGKFIGL